MKNMLSLIFFLSVQHFTLAQCNDADKYDLGGSYFSRTNNYIPFNYIPENAIDSIFYGIDIKHIQKYSDFLFEKAKQYIIKRASEEFYNKLEFHQLEVNYTDVDIQHYEDESLYNLKNYNCTYWLIFTYRHKNVEYAFGLEFDKSGNMISENQFPEFKHNKDFENFISVCEALEVVKNHENFNGKKVDFIELSYLKEANSFCWLIQEVKEPNKELEKWEEYSVNQYYINANTGKLETIKRKSGISIACGFSLDGKK